MSRNHGDSFMSGIVRVCLLKEAARNFSLIKHYVRKDLNVIIYINLQFKYKRDHVDPFCKRIRFTRPLSRRWKRAGVCMSWISADRTDLQSKLRSLGLYWFKHFLLFLYVVNYLIAEFATTVFVYKTIWFVSIAQGNNLKHKESAGTRTEHLKQTLSQNDKSL